MAEEPLASARSEKRKDRNRHAPEHVHVEDLPPVVEAAPGGALRPDGGVVHEHTDLREEGRREACEVIAARRIQPPLAPLADGGVTVSHRQR